METEFNKEKMLERIRRLLALSKSTNVHEAEAAAAKAQELLFKYNIDEADVPGAQKAKSTYQKVLIELGEGRAVAWKRTLLFAVARTNFCTAFFSHSIDSRGHLHRLNRMSLVGEPHNIEVVSYLLDYLSSEIIRLSEDLWYKEGTGSKSSWKTSFCYGAVQGVSEVLQIQADLDRQKYVHSTALIVLKDKDLSEAIETLVGTDIPIIRMDGAVTNHDGIRTGYNEGLNIQLRKGIKE